MSQKRLVFFDLLKLFAIYLVIIGHCIQYMLSSNCYDNPIYLFIYSFHMPLFMAISGYFSTKSYTLSVGSFISKKSRELLLPVLSWGLIFFIGNAIINTFKEEPFFIAYDLKAIYIQNLWFLKSLFVCYCFAYFSFKREQVNYYLLISTLIISQFITSHNICTMYPIFIFGIIIKQYQHHFISKSILVFTFIVFSILLSVWDASFWPVPDMITAFCINNYQLINEYIYKGGFRILLGIIGSLFFINLFYTLKRSSSYSYTTKLSYYGKYTLEIYILQSFLLEYTLGKYINFDSLDYYTFHLIIAPLFSLILLTICVCIARITNKNKKLSFLLWGKKKL